MTSSIFKPHFPSPTSTLPSEQAHESPYIQSLISSLNLMPHIEGGFFIETDRGTETIPSPFPPPSASSTNAKDLAPQRPGFDPEVRNTSTTIFYLLTPSGPQGGFHRNLGRTVHTLHRGRGRYVLIHADEGAEGEEKRIETFLVGQDVAQGERLQWIVDGGKFKASFLLSDSEGGSPSEGLLISETVVPGFEFCDHDFLSKGGLKDLVGEEKSEELSWLLSPLSKGE